MQENRLGHEGEGMSPLQKRAREARNRLIAAGVLPETTTTPTTPVVPTRTNRISASSQSSFGPIPHVDSSRVRQRAQQSFQPPVAPDQPPTAPGAPPRRRVGVGGGPVLEPQRAPQLSGEIPRQAQELLKQIAREIQSIEMRINLMGRGAVGETATTRLIDLLMDLASVSAANPTNTTLSERVEETQRKIQALFATGGTRPTPPAPGETPPAVEPGVGSDLERNLRRRLVRWELIKSLVPKDRKESESLAFYRNKLVQIQAQDAALAQQLREMRFAEHSAGEALGVIARLINEEYASLTRSSGRFLEKRGIPTLDALIESTTNEFARFRDIVAEYIAPPEPSTMSLKEVAEYMSEHPEAANIANYAAEFERKLEIYKEEPERSFAVLLAAAAKALVVGSPAKKDWSTDVNAVIAPAARMNLDFERLTTAFLRTDGRVISNEEIARGAIGVEIRAIEMWDYIVARIKHKPDYGGLSSAVGQRASGELFDATNKYLPQRSGESNVAYQRRLARIKESDGVYSYTSTTGNTADDFTEHIKLVFDDIPSEQRDILIMFYKAFAAKSAAYVGGPLPTGQTRAHGMPVGATSVKDESRYLNPFSLRLYQSTRYAALMTHRSLFRFAMVDRGVFLKLLAIHKDQKKFDGEAVYDLFTAWIKVNYGTIPEWVKYTRSITALRDDGPPLLNLMDTIYPTVPEVFTHTMGLDHEKSLLIAQLNAGQISRSVFDTRVRQIVERYQHQGYFDYSQLKKAMRANDGRGDTLQMLQAMRGRKLLFSSKTGDTVNLDLGQYNTSATAIEEMFDIFDTRPQTSDPGLTDGQIITDVLKWCSGYIGKAKLIPGPHHLLFAPMTCEYIARLMHAYQFAGNEREVRALFKKLMREVVLNAEGLPLYSKEEVARLFGGRMVEKTPSSLSRKLLGSKTGFHFDGKVPDYLTYRQHANARAVYSGLYQKYALSYDSTPSSVAKRLMPLGGQQLTSPFISDQVVDKDTSKPTK